MIICTLYGLAAVVSFIQLIMLINRGGKEQNIYQVLMYVMVCVCNIGYFAMSIAKTVDMAIICNSITYLGGVFLPLCVLLRTAEFCGITLRRSTISVLTAGSGVVFSLVFSTGYSDIYYKNVSIKKIYGVTHLVKEYGPAHNAYKILLGVYVLVSVLVVIGAFRRKNHFTKRTVFSMVANILAPCIVYLVERKFALPIELLPFTYMIVLGVYLNSVNRMKMYDMSSSIASAYEKLDGYGYITFDLKKNLMNCNNMAYSIFPELKSMEIDESAKKDNSVFYNEIIQWLELEETEDTKEKKISVDDKIIKCKLRRIHIGVRNKFVGYSVELMDNTNEENYIKLLNNYNSDLSKQVEEKTAHIKSIQNSIITGMAIMVEGRDNSTGGHVRRTSECVKVFANDLKWKIPELSVRFLSNLIKAAPMHDLGKIAVDDQILRKPGKFTDEEYAKMKTHAAKGAQIVEQVLTEVKDEDFKKIAVNVAHYHHEKWDGSGYPDGLSGEDIPLEARIMALADVFDALVSKRCYKEAFDFDRAFKIIEESLGSHFDPKLGSIFMECRPRLEKLYNDMPE